ncbi:MAG: (2E,6E)-farnesyl diphosphate synthase [Pseudomonadales bacterium]
MPIQQFIRDSQARVDIELKQHLNAENSIAPRLYDAMHYSVFNGGKRIRPVLVYATAVALKSDSPLTDVSASAVELIHAYSLIHDDLPAMDDDDLRRGKPTCHIAFDEATAILAGDALQTLAFEILIDSPCAQNNAAQILQMVSRLAKASGAAGMVGGQAFDLYSTGKQLSLEALIQMHRHKTGALISASVILGALASGNASSAQLAALEQYAACIGLAFQIKDDILDVESDTETLGKQQGADETLNKATYTSILGLEKAKQEALSQHQQALTALDIFGPEADNLRQLSAYIIERNK